jgi:starch synthase
MRSNPEISENEIQRSNTCDQAGFIEMTFIHSALKMKVLFVVSELAPWVKTGGLGDVASALPAAMHAARLDIRILVPAYPALKAAFPDATPLAGFSVVGRNVTLLSATINQGSAQGLPLYLLECGDCFERLGNPYLGPDGLDWPDNALRFGALSRVAALLAGSDSPLAWRPDILHCNDWQTALAPAYQHYLPTATAAASVITIHNLAFQGLYAHELLPQLELPEHAWAMDGVEYHGYLSFLKAGLQWSEAITTVSPTYAQEIQTSAMGMGLDGLLRHRTDRLTGILNGIDTAQWNPATDPYLAAPYDAKRLAAKAANKAALRVEMGLADTNLPVLGIVSRFTEQKGLDLVVALAEELAALPVQLAVLGNGDTLLEEIFNTMAQLWPGQFAVRIGFDEALAHRIEAGADLFLMPSRFEPCGLNQMYSLRYGTPPIVHATGGLADTVIDAAQARCGNGFVFSPPTPDALINSIRRAVALWRNTRRWQALQRRAMKADFSWDAAVRQYTDIYRALSTARENN